MQKVKEFIQELRDIANYKSQIKLLNKRIEELKRQVKDLDNENRKLNRLIK